MPKQTVPMRGGLNTRPDRSLVAPGQMTRCMNFEVTKSGTVRRALGYRRWSGGCWYGPPSFFMWGPYDSAFDQGSAIKAQWGLPGGLYERNATSTWIDYGKIAPYAGRARLTYHYEFVDKTDNYGLVGSPPSTSGIVAVGLQGRELIRPERLSNGLGTLNNETINQTFGIDATWSLTSLPGGTATPAVEAHEIIDRAWPAYFNQYAGQGIEPIAVSADPGGVGSVPGYHPFGGIAGMTYWRDRLYVVSDILSFNFDTGSQQPNVGDVVTLRYVNSPDVETGWKWTVERIIVTSGGWEDGDAAGTILLIGGVTDAPTNAYPAMLATPGWSSAGGRLLDDGSDFTSVAPGVPWLDNETLATDNVLRLLGYADPVENGAALWRSIDLYDVPATHAWERVDLGYEVPFKDGDNAFVVVNRLSSDPFLDGAMTAGTPDLEVTDWQFAAAGNIGAAVIGSATLDDLATDDATGVALFSSFGGTPQIVHPVVELRSFGFFIPEYSIITGVEVEMGIYNEVAVAGAAQFQGVSLKLPGQGGYYGNRAPTGDIPTTTTNTYTVGSQTDLWDSAISPAAASDDEFGIVMTFTGGQVRLDYLKVRIHYKPYVSTVYFRDPTDASKNITAMTVGILAEAVSAIGEIQGTAAGDSVTIAGATPSAYNGAVTLIEPGALYPDASDIRAYYVVTGAPLTATPATGTITLQTGTKTVTITRPFANTTAWVTFSAPHNITQNTGYTMAIAGATQPEYNGTGLAFQIINATTLSYTVTGSPATPATGAPTFQLAAQSITLGRAADSKPIARAALVGHGYLDGQYVTVSTVTQPEYNGTFQVYPDGVDAFRYLTLTDPSANPTTAPFTAIRNAVASGSAVWYYKEKGEWTTLPNGDARGILTIYDVDRPSAIKGNQQIRSASSNTGTLYALTDGAAERMYLPSSKDIQRNQSRYEWLIANFTRSSVFEQLFGVSGAGLAFSFDGKYFIRIRTGLSKALDRPRHLAEHNFQLALGYSFGDVAFSDLGYGESFSALFDGASPASLNIAFAGGSTVVSVADPVHGLLRLPEQSLAVFCEGSIRRISGSGGVFTEQVVRAGHGVLEYTARNVNGMIAFTDSLGMMVLRPTDLFGQLLPQYVSSPVAELLDEVEASSLSGPRPKALFAMPFNNKNQYRLFHNDGSYLVMTLVGPEMQPQFWVGQYDFVPACVGIGVHSDKSQVQFAGHVFTSNYLLNMTVGPGGAGSQVDEHGAMEVNPCWPFQLDVSSTWDTDPMPALVTFFLGDMADQGGLHADKRFGSVAVDVRAYGYAQMAMVFSSQWGLPVAARVRSTDFAAETRGLPASVGNRADGDYLNIQQYRSTINSNCRGEFLLMTVESDGQRDYDAGANNVAGVRWIRPFEIGVAAVSFDMNKNPTATETSGTA